MSDQADSLRALAQAGARDATCRPPREASNPRERTLWFVGAKGGVGTSSLVVNLGMSLARLGYRVRAIDANPNNQDLAALCAGVGVDAEIFRAGRFRVETPRVTAAVGDDRREPADFTLVDTGSGIERIEQSEGSPVDAVIVTTPEPIALRRAEELVRSVPAPSTQSWRAVITQTASIFEARETLAAFLAGAERCASRKVIAWGHVRTDDCMRHAVRAGVPAAWAHPHCAAGRCVRRMVTALLRAERAGERVRAVPAWKPRLRFEPSV